MNDWTEWKICAVEDLRDPGAREFEVGGGDWPFRGVLVRRRGGLFAYANVCPHRGHPLNLAADDFLTPDGNLLRCASHGAMFVPETGFCLAGPCAARSLLQLECRVMGGHVLVKAPSSMRSYS